MKYYIIIGLAALLVLIAGCNTMASDEGKIYLKYSAKNINPKTYKQSHIR